MNPRYFYVLLTLFILFFARVSVQLLQYYFNFEFFPSFENWHSDTLPYGLLLFFQLIIIFLCVSILIRVKNGFGLKNKYTIKVLFIFGIIYLFIMLFRLFLGMTFMSNHYWMDNPLPTIFHIVLAMFVLTYYHYLRTKLNE